MKVLIICEKYPNKLSGYNNDFVHQRNREYVRCGFDVSVLVEDTSYSSYKIDGINVYSLRTIKNTSDFIKSLNPNLLGIHFYKKKYYNIIEKFDGKVVLWIHGHEIINWYHRIYDYNFKKIIKHLPGLIWMLVERKLTWHKINRLSKKENRIYFIFVSNWMKKIAEKDNWIKIKNSVIIPNGIDLDRFNFTKKSNTDRFNVLSIRPYNSHKYANDITVDTILKFSKMDGFKNFNFTLIGDGKYFKKITNSVKIFDNVTIIQRFVPNHEIPAIHKNYGILLSPTRQDAQGVTMCEAMSSGLVPITSNNTAIPEFVTHKFNGLLCKNNASDFANALDFINKNPSLFVKMSLNAGKSISRKCGNNNILAHELKLFKR